MRLLTRGHLLTVLFSLACMIHGHAQPGDPQGDPDQVPIHGIGYLIAAGVLLGINRIRKMKNVK